MLFQLRRKQLMKKMKVLVVDDDQWMVKTISDILKIKGYQPLAAHTGEEAIEKVKSSTPDCVLMDIKMSGIDGVESLKRLKRIVPGLPVVLMSAHSTEEQVEEAKRLGAQAVFNKPIDIQTLLCFLSLLKKEKCILVVDDDPLSAKRSRRFCRQGFAG
jgi:CheY-like chemotaxis protein